MPAANGKRPLIGCMTYRKTVAQPGIEVCSLASTYIESVIMAGGVPLLIPFSLNEEALEISLSQVDGILLPGGGDIEPHQYNGCNHPKLRGMDSERDRADLFAARYAVAQQKPLLAICRGHQVLNVALGGSMWEDVASQISDEISHDICGKQPRNSLLHTVDIQPDSKLFEIVGRETSPVNSIHHQGVRELGEGLVVTAVAPDGVIEGIELPEHPFAIGIQWHPECLVHDDPAMLRLFEGLVEASR